MPKHPRVKSCCIRTAVAVAVAEPHLVRTSTDLRWLQNFSRPLKTSSATYQMLSLNGGVHCKMAWASKYLSTSIGRYHGSPGGKYKVKMAEIQSEIQSEIQRISYKSKTSFGIEYEFDPVMVSWLCDHRVDACGNQFELGCLWCMAGLSGNNSVKWQPTKVDP